MRATITLGLLLTAGSGLSVYADNWPQWRGPQLDGTSKEAGLPSKWSPTENVAWKTPLPMRSGATPIVWKDHVFLNVAEAGSLYLWALDRNTGAVRWKQLLGGGDHDMRKQNMSSPSPVTDGTAVWVMTGTGVLKSFTFDGKERWARDIPKDYGAFGLNWGYASSPLLLGDALYVQVLHGMKTDDPSYLLRIDKTTGKTVWKQERPTKAIAEAPDAYTTPVPLKVDNRTEIVVSGGDIVTAHDPATGKELWRSDGLNPTNHQWQRIIASPVVLGSTVYAPSRVKPLLALKGGGSGDVTATHRLWQFENGPDVPTPVVDGTHFYSFDDRGVVYCLDAKTGKNVYGPVRIKPGTYSASPVLGDGKIYAPSRVKPLLALKGGGSGDVTATHRLWQFENGPDVPTPVVDGTYFYSFDDRGVVYCLDAKTGKNVYGPVRIKPGTYSASPVLGDGKIYITSEEGLTTVVKAGPAFEVVAENAINEYVLSSIAISDGQLFLRGDKHLYAIGQRRK